MIQSQKSKSNFYSPGRRCLYVYLPRPLQIELQLNHTQVMSLVLQVTVFTV
jgi:hypothetical protein